MSKGFEQRKLPDGKENPKYVDLLEEDKPISGQKFVCLSFLSPEKILKNKNLFFFEKFLKHFDFSKSVQKFTDFLNFISYKYDIEFDDVMKDFNDYLSSEKGKLEEKSIDEDYKNFIDSQEDKLQEEFDIAHDFKTNIRGVKIRGSFASQQEAQLRCRMLREVDPNHDIYVGQVGMWMPFDPDAYKTGKVEYMEEELNELMAEKNKNDKLAKNAFDKRVKESKKKAIADNIKKAKESGNKLTQTINKDGDLVGVGVNTITKNLGEKEEVTSADIRKELFEGENIRTKAFDKENPDRRYKEVIERDGALPTKETPKNVKLEVITDEQDEDNDNKN